MGWQVGLAQSFSQAWEYVYPDRPFEGTSLIDLSYLNEAVAGENGFIQLSPDGEYFVNGQGERVRFWAVNGGDLIDSGGELLTPMSNEELQTYARFLARMGVNMIRYHTGIHSPDSLNINAVDTTEVDYIWRLMSAMKEQGIYTTISPYWPLFVEEVPAEWELGDYVGNKTPLAVLHFDSTLQEAYKNWVTYLYTETNPYTGIALKDDPAVGLIQVQNEDGVFFWTIQGVEPSLMAEMERQYYDFLIEKYGQVSAAYAAWSQTTLPADDPGNDRMGLYIIWEATQVRTGGVAARLTDQMEFYTQSQRSFYQEMYDHYRSLGCQQLINASNWKTASPTRLFDLERYTNAVAEVQAVNRYFSPSHIGENSGWLIEPGHFFVGKSALRQPHKLPINIKQVAGQPMIVTESAWNLPNIHQAEGPFLISAYLSLSGVDGYYWFSPTAPTMDDDPYWFFRREEGSMYRWTISTPGQMGLFPANALLYRRGYLQESEPVVHEHRSLQAMYDREIPLISEENSFDPNRDSYDNNNDPEATELAPITYLSGKVQVTYDSDPANTFISPGLDTLLNFQEKVIRSTTGELLWDYEQGLCLMNAPAARGLCGFPEAGETYQLGSLRLTTDNEYAAVNVVSMDGNPLESAEQVLVQVGTRYRPKNWRQSPATFERGGEQVEGFRIDDTGVMPWWALPTQLTLSLENPNLRSAHLLDAAGREVEQIYVEKEGNTLTVDLPDEAMYVVLDPRESTAPPPRVAQDLEIFPNPARPILNIRTTTDFPAYDRIEFIDVSGRFIMQLPPPETNPFRIDLAPGIYFLLFKSGDTVIARRKLMVK